MRIGIVDIETTDFLNRGGHIVEIGIAELHTTTGKIKPAYHTVCREAGMTGKDRTAWIFQNSDLTVEEVRAAPDLESIRSDVAPYLDGYFDLITAYNKSFDFDFLRDREFQIGKEALCPMRVATPICKLPGRRGFKWPSVEEAWRHFFPDEPYIEAHRGLDDAMHEARIVYELVKLGHIGNTGN